MDTGYLFPATYQYAEFLEPKMDFKATGLLSKFVSAFQEARHGKLWEGGKEEMSKYNFINKREPMNRALRTWGYDLVGWFEKKSVQIREKISILSRNMQVFINCIRFWIGMIGQLINICQTMTFLIIRLRNGVMNRWAIGIVPKNFRG